MTVAEQESPRPNAGTGIAGLDEITGGGLPKGRTNLLVGGTGCGKTSRLSQRKIWMRELRGADTISRTRK